MGIDIAENLFPNILTLLTQLAATFVIYKMYKKFLHESVVDYLERRQEKMATDMAEADAARKDAAIMKEQVKVEYDKSFAELEVLKKQLIHEANLKKAEIIKEADIEVENMRKRNEQALERDRKEMYKEVNDHVLSVATELNRKVLENMTFDESEVLNELAKELDEYDA